MSSLLMLASFILALGLCVNLSAASNDPATFTAERFAGGGEAEANVPATQAKIDDPFGVERDTAGNLYIVTYNSHRIFRVAPDGTLTVYAGTGEKGGSGDGGPATSATMASPHALAIHPTSNDLYIADTFGHRVRKIDAKTGIITSLAGTGTKGFNGDGKPGDQTQLADPHHLSLDLPRNRLLVADLGNSRVRAIDLATGIVSAVAGDPKGEPYKDGGNAKAMNISTPRAVLADKEGRIYVLYRGKGGPLRRIDTDGMITTLLDEKSPDPLKGPKHLFWDLDGDLLIADSDNHRICKYLVGEQKLITLAGTGKPGTAGLPGPALQAQLNKPHGIFAHPDGSLLISDSSNDRVVRVRRKAE